MINYGWQSGIILVTVDITEFEHINLSISEIVNTIKQKEEVVDCFYHKETSKFNILLKKYFKKEIIDIKNFLNNIEQEFIKKSKKVNYDKL